LTSHTKHVDPADINDVGGPAAYVLAWLEACGEPVISHLAGIVVFMYA
jgi:hypothetical protein